MVALYSLPILLTISFSAAFPQLVVRDDLPVANYSCKGVGNLPTNGCYPTPNTVNTTQAQAWGVYLDNQIPIQLTPAALGNLPLTCAGPMNALCVFINNHIDDPTIRNHWIWSISYGPGCVAAVYLPEANHVPEPTYGSCHSYIDVPLRDTLSNGVGASMTRASINLAKFPSLPDTASLTQTLTQGPLPIDPVPEGGGSVNGSLSSWMVQA